MPRTVVLTGEVRFPGRYTLLTRTERLSDVIQRAGGLTEHAYANGIRFFRADPTMTQGLDAATAGQMSGTQRGFAPKRGTVRNPSGH